MRILQVHTRYRQPGGEDAVVETEGRILEEAGHTVATHLMENPERLGATLGSLARAPWNTEGAREVLETARRFRPDVVHVHNTWFALSPAVFPTLKNAGFPVVATIHNFRLTCVNALLYRDGGPCMDCVGRSPWPGVQHRCYRRSAIQSGVVAVTIATHRRRRTFEKDVDRMIVLTRFAVDVLARAGVPEKLMVVKPNAVEDPGARSMPPSGARSILFVGRITEEKGVMDLVDAWGKSDRPGLDLVVIGDGPLLEDVRARAGHGVEVLGALPRTEVRRRMLGARALVLPSRWFEGMPMVLLEAMAAGLPVVVPDHGAMVEIAGSGGIPFRALDIGSLAGALDQLADDELADRLGASSRASYLDRYTPDASAKALLETYALVTSRVTGM
ncbi:MAG: glycosyltransferase family 4 protein [Acidimicrobiia bacterium]